MTRVVIAKTFLSATVQCGCAPQEQHVLLVIFLCRQIGRSGSISQSSQSLSSHVTWVNSPQKDVVFLGSSNDVSAVSFCMPGLLKKAPRPTLPLPRRPGGQSALFCWFCQDRFSAFSPWKGLIFNSGWLSDRRYRTPGRPRSSRHPGPGPST